MTTHTDFWSEFPSVSSEQWRRSIELSLKGKPYEDLLYRPGTGLNLEPFYKDFIGEPGLPLTRPDNQWQIVERVVVGEDMESARIQALQALEGGATALAWQFAAGKPALQDLERLCQGIHLSMIETHWEGFAADDAFLQALTSYAGSLSGSVECPHDPLFMDYKMSFKKQPELRLWTFKADTLLPANERLAQLLLDVHGFLSRCLSAGLSASDIAPRIRLVWTLSHAYLLEIASLRALHRLWAALLSSYSLPNPCPACIYAQTQSQQPDPYGNLIATTSQALAAVIGHCQSVCVQPFSEQAERAETARRLARNIQHVLAMESFMSGVIDPAAGSYYLERATDQIAQTAWSLLQARAV